MMIMKRSGPSLRKRKLKKLLMISLKLLKIRMKKMQVLPVVKEFGVLVKNL